MIAAALPKSPKAESGGAAVSASGYSCDNDLTAVSINVIPSCVKDALRRAQIFL
jgi:hypothetical protein